MNAKSKIFVSLLAIATAVPALAADAPKPVAKVNGTSIPSTYVDVLSREQRAQGAPNNERLQQAIKEELIRREVLTQEARKQGYDKKQEVTVRQEMARQSVLIGVFIEDWARAHPVTDAQVRAEYDKQVKEAGSSEYKLRHIQTLSEEEAAAIITKLKAGANFESLAKQSSKDDATKDSGGDLGWGRLNVLPFGDALTKLDKGQFTPTPVKSQFGFHVVLVEDIRKFDAPAFDTVKDRIRQTLQQKSVAEYISSLVKKAKID